MTSRLEFVVLGSGGLAHEMAQLVSQTFGQDAFLGFIDRDSEEVPSARRRGVLGDDEWLRGIALSRDDLGVVLGSGFPAFRVRMADLVEELGLPSPPLLHRTAVLDQDQVHLGSGSVVCAGVVTTCNVVVGDGVLLNLNATVGHDVSIGRCSVINPGAHVSGGVSIGAGVLVGAGAVVLQGLSVGDGATVGAGAVVTKDVQPRETVMGVPARPAGSA